MLNTGNTEMKHKPLWNWNVILLIDSSGSMIYSDQATPEGKIGTVKHFIDEFLRELVANAPKKNINIKVRILSFSEECEWLIGSCENAQSLNSAYEQWAKHTELFPHGLTTLSNAIYATATALLYDRSMAKENNDKSVLAPAILLFSDGIETEDPEKINYAISKIKDIAPSHTLSFSFYPGDDYFNDRFMNEFAAFNKSFERKHFSNNPFCFYINDSPDSLINGERFAKILLDGLITEDHITPQWGEDESGEWQG